ncbi:Arm DNA-binding domain-containing protein [Zhouia amylolytica]|uniref:Arm DNA-binding domain-containing protein n=1 Tax=Zhouia amylolytica TaxID=376730 RepID=UPI0020CF3E13|nr:Arm DNA-binding domain-containing protein [Zhouia amylolytica]MCQ0112472.1 hypothetical protein [Zhouia amylolytica]
MNPQKVNILFVLKKQKLNKKGLAPLYCRLTYNNKRKELATGIVVSPKRVYFPFLNNKRISSKRRIIPNKTNCLFINYGEI